MNRAPWPLIMGVFYLSCVIGVACWMGGRDFIHYGPQIVQGFGLLYAPNIVWLAARR